MRDTIGYKIQIKQQAPWPSISGLPAGKTTTVVGHNVYTKGSNSSTGGSARPNLLFGDVPASGPGSTNGYEVYGDFFYQNPTEALFQAEGNVALYANLLDNNTGSALNIQRHNGVVREIRIFGNTVLAADRGISVSSGGAAYTQQVAANAVFAATPISAANATANITDPYDNAASYLNSPTGALGQLDLYPKVGALRRTAFDASSVGTFAESALDFNGAARDWCFLGAYSGEGTIPDRLPKIDKKPQRPTFSQGEGAR